MQQAATTRQPDASRGFAGLQYILLTIIALLALTHFYLGAEDMFHILHRGQWLSRLPFAAEVAGPVASRIRPEASRAGIATGDTILTVNARPFTDSSVLLEEVHRSRPGQQLFVVFRHAGGSGQQSTSVTLSPQHAAPTPVYSWITHGCTFLLSLVCLLTGMYVVLARPRNPQAWLILAIVAPFATLFIPGTDLYTPFRFLGLFWTTISQTAMPLCLMLFGIRFPRRSRIDLRYPWIKWLLLSLPLLLMPVDLLSSYAFCFNFAADAWITPLLPLVNRVENFFSVLCILYFFICLGLKLNTATGDARRRLRVLLAGCSVGFLPFFVLVLIATVRNRSFQDVSPQWVIACSMIVFLLLPLSLAYVMIVQRAMEVRLLIRQGTIYFFARGTLYFAGILLTVWMARSITAFVARPQPRDFADLLRVLAAIGVFLAFRFGFTKQLRRRIDKRFFREAYSSEQILSELSRDARSFTEVTPLIQTMAQRIGEALHIERIAVFLRIGDTFALELVTGTPFLPAPQPLLYLSAASPMISRLARTQTPTSLTAETSPAEMIDSGDPERAILNELSAEMLVPLPGRQRLAGFMTLGPKRSEEPYTKADRQMLLSIGSQAGLALENAELFQKLTLEVAQRERIWHEIEVAREVQERLLPQSYPVVPGVDLAGYYRPAQVIGGDYYDCFLLPANPKHARRLALVLGDASGKGISAALMMAGLRASLRSLAIQQEQPSAIVRGVNRLLYGSSTGNRYATLFYAEFEPDTSMLIYVNAGHNPPVVLRSGSIIRLEATGTVAGLFAEVDYEQACFQMEPGDVLLAFSDGISEATDATDTEWGEENLLATLEQLARQSGQPGTADQYVTSILQVVDGFTAGAPQHDDMTLLVCRLAPAFLD